MKKIICILLMSLSLIAQTSFAYVYGKVTSKPSPIYCPSEIECRSNELGSCSIDLGLSKYFKLRANGPSIQGTSKIFYVALPSQATTINMGKCVYRVLINGNIITSLTLFIIPEADLVPYRMPSSAWLEGAMDCYGANCPLRESGGFLIHNINLSGLYASIGGVDIDTKPIPSTFFRAYIFDDLLVGCGGTTLCIVDLLTDKHAKIGSITLSMDTLEILEVNAIYPSKIAIKKVDSYNVIEILHPD